MLRFFQYVFCLIFFALFFSGCKKTESPAAVTTISLEPSVVNLRRDRSSVGTKLTPVIKGLQPGDSESVIWSSENPRIAKVTEDGRVWPEGVGETYILATLISGKGVAKCKVVVTDSSDYKFRLILKDKGTNLSLNRPETFLSQKAIQRRLKRNIPIDESDLPISGKYLDAIQEIGGTIVAKSKWLNTVTVHVSDYALVDKFKALPFVKDAVLVWERPRTAPPATGKYVDVPQTVLNHTSETILDYGAATNNIQVNSGEVLHQQGFKGEGIDIAVIDAGFSGLKDNQAFSNVNIRGAKSFVYENDNPYAVGSHGVWVTSCMAVNQPGKYIGTAPEANYWLLRTEDESSEYPVEEDYWVNAAEFADSAGVDIINSSLYYTTSYGIVSARYRFEDMDGKTAFASRGANMASNKGIFIVNCTGNEPTWVGTPADSPNLLTVGSVNASKIVDAFHSSGITVDGRIKPDVLAMGLGASVVNLNGISEMRTGTSYASPIICGLAACLWQAYPKLSNKELLEVIRKSSDRGNNPALPYGYGVADMQKAMDLAKSIYNIDN